MTSDSPPVQPAVDLPVDAVAFTADAVVDPAAPEPATGSDTGSAAAPRPTPGVRRLVTALTAAGVATYVIAPRHQGNGHHDSHHRSFRDHLRQAGLSGVAGEGFGVVGAGATVPGTARARTLVVTRRETAAGMVGAGHPVAIVDGRSVPHAVFDWLAERVGPFRAAAALVAPPDEAAASATRIRHLRLTKPPGSLGRIEDVGAHLAAIAGETPPPVPRPAATAVFAGDHGVHAQGVSPWPQEVTTQMVANFLGGGAAVNVLAGQSGARVVVVDVGVAGDVAPADRPRAGGPGGDTTGDPAAPRLFDRKIRRGTGDLSTGPAMTPDEARRGLDVGVEVAARLVGEGARCLITGDMGIANTTPSAALIASLTDRPAAGVTGPGAAPDDDLLTRKTALVAAAAARARFEHGDDALAVLAEVGGLEHAALAGFVAGAAALQVPVVIDGVIAAAALLVASRLVPGVERCVIAGHRSAEPGATAVLDELGLAPLLDLGLRLGEGTGAVLALPLVEAAARVLHEMATFDQAGITDKR
jgi:nicotinate-nucleotide--dimethylbenzimidazole phosphoribosyltransferase